MSDSGGDRVEEMDTSSDQQQRDNDDTGGERELDQGADKIDEEVAGAETAEGENEDKDNKEIESTEQQKEEDGKEEGEKEIVIPSHEMQKKEIQPLLTQRLKKGDQWYLLDQKWLKQWKKYTGFDSWDQYSAGDDSTNPGPVDNSNLFMKDGHDTLKDHLMEELDYALLPKSAWDKLVSWYGLSANSKPLPRCVVEYGTYVKHLKVEVYLFDLKLCIHPHVNEIKIGSFSRADTIECLQNKLREIFQVPQETQTRLWQRYMTNSYELLSNLQQTISDAGIYGGQMIMIEKQKPDGQWERASAVERSSVVSSGYSTRSSSQMNSYSYSSYSSYGREPSTPGLCGLSNLGNTCFMNSALQCLGNTQPLVEYFIGKEGAEKPYKKHINRNNPLGMGGAIADTYGALLEDMWSGHNSYLAPRSLKNVIGKHAPQFSGYMQHDSHELLAFLLDGLHEDLNLVKKKPYVDMDIKTEKRNDSEIARETWHKYLLRNQSVIVRLFQGQLKSTLKCPKCEKISRIFDPFMYLSLPLPYTKTREIYVYLIKNDPSVRLMRYRLTVPKNGCVVNLKEAMQKVTGSDPANLVVIDVYHSRFHRVYYDKDPLNHIMDRDDIYLYELKKPLGDQEWVPVPVYMREIKTHQSTSYYGQRQVTTYGQVFGLPVIVTVPRKGCTYRVLYDIILAQIDRCVIKPVKNVSTNKESEEEEKEGQGEEKITNEEKEEEEENRDEDMKETDEGEMKEKEDENDGGTVAEEMDVQSTTEPEPSNDNNNEVTTTSNGNENLPPDEDEGNKSEEPMDTESSSNDKSKDTSSPTSNDLFKLVVVNSYGSQELQKLKDDGQLLKLTSQTYIGCDWDINTRDAHYDVQEADTYDKHESCQAAKEEKKEITIYNCMDLFVNEETLGEDDAWYCPTCKEFVQATKKFDLWKMPDVLVIHLKRFSYNRYFRNKLEARVDFPLQGLDLSDYVVNSEEHKPVLYDLFAVSNHYGGLGGGHYTAYAKNKDTGKWYSFDDSHVSEVTNPEQQICSSSSYVLFYQRKTEGRSRPEPLNRSLSVSFDEEVKEGQKRFHKKQSEQSADSKPIEEEKENGESNDETFEDHI